MEEPTGIRELKKLSIFREGGTPRSTLSKSKFLEYKNLLGKKINKWTIIDILDYRDNQRDCLAECECGNIFKRELKGIVNGHSTQCRSCSAFQHFTKCDPKPNHQSKKVKRTFYDKERRRRLSPEYHCWVSMRARCLCETDKGYFNYGGRGIKICDRWLESFDFFIEDMGRRPTSNHSLDRVDVNGNYCKENCRWATAKQQANNKRKVKDLHIENILLKNKISKYIERLGEID
jgi:hypothetical protein